MLDAGKKHKSIRQKTVGILNVELQFDELVRWEVRKPGGYLAYFTVDILDILSLLAVGWWECRVRGSM